MGIIKTGTRAVHSRPSDCVASQMPVAVKRGGRSVSYFIPVHGQAGIDLAAALMMASAELDRMLAAEHVDVEAMAAEFNAVRKAGAARR